METIVTNEETNTKKKQSQMQCGANNSSMISIDSIEFVMYNLFFIFIGRLEFHINFSLRSRRVCFQSWLLLYKTLQELIKIENIENCIIQMKSMQRLCVHWLNNSSFAHISKWEIYSVFKWICCL